MKHVSLGTFLVAASLILVTGCAPSPSTPTGTPPGGAAPVAPAAGKADTGKMTEDIWVELAAQEMYHGNTDQEGWVNGSERQRLYAKYGVTEEQVSVFAESVGRTGEYEHLLQLMARIDQRVKELQAGK